MKRMFYTGWMLALCFFLSGWNNMQAQTYEKLWKQVEQAQQKSLPQTVVKLTEEICRKALDEKSAFQRARASRAVFFRLNSIRTKNLQSFQTNLNNIT